MLTLIQWVQNLHSPTSMETFSSSASPIKFCLKN